ncbi:MAG TPA: YkgJ family cysteine cluster protein [Anaerohalosphaeraceae bacterium]|nr:YkgJ family cysteine cluster protein [Anaerohalosphaeraceae bacterium]HOL30906.1 YkgJ family cysteine cluster protein [Anaerohalosphaeraceae bacterium]HOM75679.1 YkgJ family cysteine cluster protein [Anaerohalosphaeraceae bacterium]HPC64222.1 YkgJ family cysteine cluster protein [Anaerohalosphaeraceae bacterium]HPO68810.1 YkgJ family cysteine cluster protein [Anaerohalosphaeraceae bacterium]
MNNTWYSSGLRFECVGCGGCCAGPAEGYIWVSKPEIEFLARHLGRSVKDFKKMYLKRIGLKYSIREDPLTKDCVFLEMVSNGCRSCAVYAVRPNQCRTWPFWSFNLHSPEQWEMAAQRCPGINRGRLYTAEEIEAIKNQQTWWDNTIKKQ